MAANALPTTYAQLYQQGPDVLQGQYAAYLAPFDPESGIQPAVLRDGVILGEHAIPKVYAYTVAQPPTIRFISRVTRVNATLGLPPTPLDDETYAFASDVGPGNQVAVVYFPTGLPPRNTEAPFAQGPMTNVPVLAEMANALQIAAAAGDDWVGPYNNGDANTEQIRARRLVPIPHKYVHLVLGQQFTPATFWNLISAAIIADNNEVSCAVVLDWARVAATSRPPAAAAAGAAAPAAGPQAPGICIDSLEPPLNEAHLQAKTWSIISSDLPALVTNNMGINNHLVNMTNEMALSCNEQATARATAAAAALERNTFVCYCFSM